LFQKLDVLVDANFDLLGSHNERMDAQTTTQEEQQKSRLLPRLTHVVKLVNCAH
jgi:hypothetical protein